ncbi:hypothetical protein HYU93_03665 [Candidatus Daviesbacteria bacterium]|nr:hypothetical protein [Candidatus Daviesbacteria bacterium]
MGIEQWVEKIKGMGLTPSTHDSHAYTPEMDVPCPQLPGIKAKFVIVGDGNEQGLESGIYLAVGILEIGISRYPVIRDAIGAFATEQLCGLQGNLTPETQRFGDSVNFKIIGSQPTGATLLKLEPVSGERFRNLGEIVENFGVKGIRITPFKDGKIPPTQ